MTAIKALLFDLDGTLLDSRQAVVEAVYYTAKLYAAGRYSYADIERRFGESFEEFINLINETQDKGKQKEIMATYLQYTEANHDQLVQLFPGIKENLTFLKNAGYQMAVVTNKQRNLTERGLQLLELDSFFETVITVDDVSKGKPYPEPVEKGCQLLKVTKQQALMIGDTVFDVKSAMAAGVKSVIIDWYQAYPVNKLVPDYIYGNMLEFITELTVQKS
ncbi:MAG: HAD-IA family hydrolase [Desulfotomaculum sp.]|nr:HAD-IA family hydrolase [Desulfotomaculum sp.]MCL0080943.1 HAD-IA family hydrolase [Peptococcaceae bacterium]